MCVENTVTLATTRLRYTAVPAAAVVAAAKGTVTFGEHLERDEDAHSS